MPQHAVQGLSLITYTTLQQFLLPFLCLQGCPQLSLKPESGSSALLRHCNSLGWNTALPHVPHLPGCKHIFCKWNLTCHRAGILDLLWPQGANPVGSACNTWWRWMTPQKGQDPIWKSSGQRERTSEDKGCHWAIWGSLHFDEANYIFTTSHHHTPLTPQNLWHCLLSLKFGFLWGRKTIPAGVVEPSQHSQTFPQEETRWEQPKTSLVTQI